MHSLRTVCAIRPANAPPPPDSGRAFARSHQQPRPLAAFPTIVSLPTVQAAAFGGPVNTRSLSAFPSPEGPASYEEAVRGLLARESSRDAEVRALRQEVGDMRQFLRALVRKPDSDEEEEYLESMASPRDLAIQPRGINLSVFNPVSGNGLLPHSPSGGFSGACSRSYSTLPEHEGFPSRSCCKWSMNSCEGFHENMPDDSEEPPPSTMYAYCVFVISTSDRFWSLWETWFLILMVTCQAVLVFSFQMSEGLKSVNKHMKQFYDESMEELMCFYGPMVYHHRPIAFIASVFCSMVIVFFHLRLLDRGTMNAIHPEPRNTMAKHLVDFVWFVQAIWLPVMFSGSTAAMLLASETPQSVVMNSVSLAYLLEADEYMYSAFVPYTNKQRYVEAASSVRKSTPERVGTKAESSLFFAAMLQGTLSIVYLHCLNYFQAEGLNYLIGMWCESFIYMAFYVVRANQILILEPSDDADHIYVYSSPTTASWKYSFAGLSLYVFLALLSAPKVLLMWMSADWSTYGCASEWLRDQETPGLQV